MPRPGPRRPLIAFRYGQEDIDRIGQRAATEDVDRSEMIRLMLAYAQQHMPQGWRPEAIHPTPGKVMTEMPTITFASPDQAQFVADIVPGLADVDGATSALTDEALARLAQQPEDYDGHYDGRYIWVGGSEYEVKQ